MDMYARKRSTLSSLPVEVLDAIMQNTSSFDQVSLCATSKLMNEIATRQLYRNIRMTSPRQIAHCCKTLSRNSLASAAVRELVIERFEFPQPGEFFQTFYRLITCALQRTCHLTTLTLLLTLDRQWCCILDTVFLPDLRDLTLVTKRSSDLAYFLHRHPQIHTLQFWCQAHDCYLHTPALLSFSGLPSMIRNIAASSPFINQLGICWEDATGEEYDDTLKALALSPVTYLGSNAHIWNDHFFEGLSRHVPQLERLEVQYTINSTDAELASLVEVLPTFKNLRSLDFGECRSTDGMSTRTRYVLEVGIVKAWSKACPSLSTIRLSATNQWKKVKSRWLPEGDLEETLFQELVGLSRGCETAPDYPDTYTGGESREENSLDEDEG